MKNSYVVDTYAWVEYFYENTKYKQAIEQSFLKTPAIVITELKRALIRRGISAEAVDRVLNFIKSRSIILDLDYDHATIAAELGLRESLHLADSIVYSYGSEESIILTGDLHFKGKKFVEFVK